MAIFSSTPTVKAPVFSAFDDAAPFQHLQLFCLLRPRATQPGTRSNVRTWDRLADSVCRRLTLPSSIAGSCRPCCQNATPVPGCLSGHPRANGGSHPPLAVPCHAMLCYAMPCMCDAPHLHLSRSPTDNVGAILRNACPSSPHPSSPPLPPCLRPVYTHHHHLATTTASPGSSPK